MKLARFDIARTSSGWHARFVAPNGQTVWVTESYTRRVAAFQAVSCLRRALGTDGRVTVRVVDERGPS